MNKTANKNKIVNPANKDGTKNDPVFEKTFKDFSPEKVKAFDEIVDKLFQSIKSGKQPETIQCAHCGGFHVFDVNCDQCNDSSAAQRIFAMERPDRFFAFAMCEKCLAVSVGVFQCKGIDPEKRDLQKLYAENAKGF